MIENLELQKMILDKITRPYQTEGPLPPLRELNLCISQMDPKELAQAIYLLEYNQYRSSFFDHFLLTNDRLESRIYDSRGVKDDIEKIFMAVAEHFRRMPQETTQVVDQIFSYFYKTLIHLATQKGLISDN